MLVRLELRGYQEGMLHHNVQDLLLFLKGEALSSQQIVKEAYLEYFLKIGSKSKLLLLYDPQKSFEYQK
jgi:hypothetical protein